MPEKAILMILTSHDTMDGTDKTTGWWLEEMAVPYLLFREAGYEVTVASPKGGAAPMDPRSAGEDYQNSDTRRFEKDAQAQQAVRETIPLASIRADDYDVLFFPGGHGPMYDLATDEDNTRITEEFYNSGKLVAAVCHGPAALLEARTVNGDPILQGKKVTCFSNTEEETVQLHTVVPFLLEERMKQAGGMFEKGEDWSSHVVVDGNLMTGQNPMSSRELAVAVLKKLKKE